MQDVEKKTKWLPFATRPLYYGTRARYLRHSPGRKKSDLFFDFDKTNAWVDEPALDPYFILTYARTNTQRSFVRMFEAG